MDREYCERLQAHLGGIRNLSQIESFDDSQLVPGSAWDTILKTRLDEADIVILLLTSNFLGSRYCTVEEMSRALNSKKFILPIVVNYIDLGSLPIANYQAMPKDRNQNLLPIVAWGDSNKQEEAWAIIAKNIRQSIQQITAKTSRSEFNKGISLIEDANINSTNTIEGNFDGVFYKVSYPSKLTSYPYIDINMKSKLNDILSRTSSDGPNEIWRSMEQKEMKDIFAEVHMDIIIEHESEKFLSMRGICKTLFYGAAHSGYETVVSNYDKTKNKNILLKDIFDLSDYTDELSRIVVRCVEHEKFLASSELDARTQDGIRRQWIHHDRFILSKRDQRSNEFDTIVLIYDPYEIGCFAEYIYEVPIPIDSVRNYINRSILNELFTS